MACTGHLRQNIGWGAGFLPDALEMLWTHSKDNGQHFMDGEATGVMEVGVWKNG